jgi:hypothetical protein
MYTMHRESERHVRQRSIEKKTSWRKTLKHHASEMQKSREVRWVVNYEIRQGENDSIDDENHDGRCKVVKSKEGEDLIKNGTNS